MADPLSPMLISFKKAAQLHFPSVDGPSIDWSVVSVEPSKISSLGGGSAVPISPSSSFSISAPSSIGSRSSSYPSSSFSMGRLTIPKDDASFRKN